MYTNKRRVQNGVTTDDVTGMGMIGGACGGGTGGGGTAAGGKNAGIVLILCTAAVGAVVTGGSVPALILLPGAVGGRVDEGPVVAAVVGACVLFVYDVNAGRGIFDGIV